MALPVIPLSPLIALHGHQWHHQQQNRQNYQQYHHLADVNSIESAGRCRPMLQMADLAIVTSLNWQRSPLLLSTLQQADLLLAGWKSE
jgi:hypothetical protein